MGRPRASGFAVCGHEVEVARKRVRYLRLSLHGDGRVALSAPLGASNAAIQAFLDSKAPWLEKKLALLREREARSFPFGEVSLFHWGVERPLCLCPGAKGAGLRLAGGLIELRFPAGADPRAAAFMALGAETLAKAQALMPAWREKLSLGQVACSVRLMKSRWGSCIPSGGRIRLNSLLAAYPPECLEYVLAHELCHFHEKNHGEGFRALLSRLMPDWEERRRTLRTFC